MESLNILQDMKQRKGLFQPEFKIGFFRKGLDGDFGASFMVNSTHILGPIVTTFVVGSRRMD